MHTGYALALINDPDAPAATWEPRIVEAVPSAFDAIPATAVVRDGSYVIALAIRQEGAHAGALVRYPAASLAKGNVSRAEWWEGDARGWVPESALGSGGPVFVMDDAGAECSLHWNAHTRSFIHIASYGFGASTIGLRTAPAHGVRRSSCTVRPSQTALDRSFTQRRLTRSWSVQTLGTSSPLTPRTVSSSAICLRNKAHVLCTGPDSSLCRWASEACDVWKQLTVV